MELSDRLKAVIRMVTAGSIVCDVGCDHGYVPVYLIRNRICPKVIAMDVNEGPLERAREHVRSFGLEEYIAVRRSDGVTALEPGEADSLILAGMGGRLVIKILTEGRKKVREAKELILQPQSDIGYVRRYLREAGYHIIEEDMVYEDGKYYPMMKAVSMPAESVCAAADKSEICQAAYDKYGEYLLKNRHPVLYQYLLWEQEREQNISHEIAISAAEKTGRHRQRQAELLRAAQIREYALCLFR